MINIMIVEDERIVALSIERELVKLGYTVVAVASSGEQALSKIAEKRPDLVLMDIHIQGEKDGIETAETIRTVHHIPVVYLTAYSEETTLQRARVTQPYGFLIKPFSGRELHATIQMALERRRADTALQAGEERLRMALDAAEMGIWEFDPDTNQIQHGGRTDQFFGLSTETFDGSWNAFIAQVHPEDKNKVTAALSQAVGAKTLLELEFRGVRPTGDVAWLKVQAKCFDPKEGEGMRVIGVVQDITGRRDSEEKLRQAAKVFESANDAIFILNVQREVVTINDAFTLITGYSIDEVLNRKSDLFPGAGIDLGSGSPLWADLEAHGRWQGEIHGSRKNGQSFPGWLSVSPVKDEQGTVGHYVGVFSDITALREAEGKLHHLAHHDPLTGLPNRLLAMDRLDRALARARRRPALVAVLFVDLDHFKRINDTLGHQAGDDLIRAVAERLVGGVRVEDTVARLGGDEFIVILDQMNRAEDVAVVAKKLLGGLDRPIIIAGRELNVSASIGISLFPLNAENRDDLIRAADVAMYAAKENGRHDYAFYTAEMTEKVSRHLALEQDLRRALTRGELVVHYQPQVALQGGAIVGLEALVRWQHPERGLLGASEIIPVAEENGLIDQVGERVLSLACFQMRTWLDAGLAPVRLAVNVSVRQMRLGRLPSVVASALNTAALKPEYLEIELTESALQLEDICIPALRELHRMGVALAIDDFGTGYSSLSSLARLPLQRCKVDQGFMGGLPANENDAAVVGAIIDLGHRLHLSVLAEGVERREQATFLRSCGCDDAQGFLFSVPVPPEAIPALLRTGKLPECALAF